VMDSSAYGARNVQIVAAGTGEALPGPATVEEVVGVWRPITDELGKWMACRVGVGGGRSTD
jgi:hypothetical protein